MEDGATITGRLPFFASVLDLEGSEGRLLAIADILAESAGVLPIRRRGGEGTGGGTGEADRPGREGYRRGTE